MFSKLFTSALLFSAAALTANASVLATRDASYCPEGNFNFFQADANLALCYASGVLKTVSCTADQLAHLGTQAQWVVKHLVVASKACTCVSPITNPGACLIVDTKTNILGLKAAADLSAKDLDALVTVELDSTGPACSTCKKSWLRVNLFVGISGLWCVVVNVVNLVKNLVSTLLGGFFVCAKFSVTVPRWNAIAC